MLTGNTRYTVFFSQAGEETIRAMGWANVLGVETEFLGTLPITVRPAAPSQISFINPPSRSQLEATPGACAVHSDPSRPNWPPPPDGCANAPLVMRGTPYPVEVEVSDRFNNAVDTTVRVNIISDNTNVGTVGCRQGIAGCTFVHSEGGRLWADVDPATGRALFSAQARGQQTQYFDMTASFIFGTDTLIDIARLRIGRPQLNEMIILYGDNVPDNPYWPEYYDSDAVINENAGIGPEFRYPIFIKAAEPMQVAAGFNGWVRLAPFGGTNSSLLRFFAAQDADESSDFFQMTNGEVTVWVGVDEMPSANIINSCVTATAYIDAAGHAPSGSFEPGERCGISLLADDTSVAEADRVIPDVEDVAVVAPIVPLGVELTVGPNPVDRQLGAINFYVTGMNVAKGTLVIYDASGDVVSRISIDNNRAAWDLSDRHGRLVSEGAYLIVGNAETFDGRRARVSALFGVR